MAFGQAGPATDAGIMPRWGPKGGEADSHIRHIGGLPGGPARTSTLREESLVYKAALVLLAFAVGFVAAFVTFKVIVCLSRMFTASPCAPPFRLHDLCGTRLPEPHFVGSALGPPPYAPHGAAPPRLATSAPRPSPASSGPGPPAQARGVPTATTSPSLALPEMPPRPAGSARPPSSSPASRSSTACSSWPLPGRSPP